MLIWFEILIFSHASRVTVGMAELVGLFVGPAINLTKPLDKIFCKKGEVKGEWILGSNSKWSMAWCVKKLLWTKTTS